METLHGIVNQPLVHAALLGFGGAFVVDVFAFMKSKTPGDFFGQWSFQISAWRWLQGTVGGVIASLGLTVV